MRTIVKRPEPASLAEYRATPGATYENYPDKDTLRTSLVSEQRGLCCYCLSRIRAEHDAMKVEHWHSQSRHGDEQLDYSNLLAVCRGNEGRRGKDQHCDTSKGDQDISRNPANQMHRVEELTRFEGNGRVYSDDWGFCIELDTILNLNHSFLVSNRKAVLDAFKDAMSKRGQLQRGTLERWLLDWNGESRADELEPYCQVIVYWIRKRLSRI